MIAHVTWLGRGISIKKNSCAVKVAKRGISYHFDKKKYMLWKLVNSFKMMK
jgi:hypothetical protein